MSFLIEKFDESDSNIITGFSYIAHIGKVLVNNIQPVRFGEGQKMA
jgi:hypothetical protein